MGPVPGGLHYNCGCHRRRSQTPSGCGLKQSQTEASKNRQCGRQEQTSGRCQNTFGRTSRQLVPVLGRHDRPGVEISTANLQQRIPSVPKSSTLVSSSHILACCLGYIHEPQGPGVQGADFLRSVTDEQLQLADQMPFFSNVLAAATVSHRCHSLKSPSRMNEKMVQNDVMNDKFVKNSVMNAQIDAKFVMDPSICKVGGWNILQPSNQTLLEEFIDE